MAPHKKYKKLLVVVHQSDEDENREVCGELETHRYDVSCEEGETSGENSEDSARKKVKKKIPRNRSWSEGMMNDNGSDLRLYVERTEMTSSDSKFTRRQKLTLISLALVDFISFCSMSIMAPFFPKEATEKGISVTMSGLVFSFYALVMFLSSPIFGKTLPWIGAKFMFMSGVFVAGTCNILFGVLEYMNDTEIFLVFCFLIRGLEALGASAYSTASYVFVINTFPNNIGAVFGILETFVGLGMSVGPAIGALLYSVGGFGLPFYVLGVLMIIALPINLYLLENDKDYIITERNNSIVELLKIPSVLVTGLVIVVISNTWSFLDPTLEPHLRQFGLSTQTIGFIFLLFSALYAIFSPIWGWLADRIQSHWCMMVWGLLLSTVGLLVLGPTPFIPALKSELWLNLVALSILGVSVALALLPTFQGVLNSCIEEGGWSDALTTYSAVAGIWSCCYSLGEVVGPALGGAVANQFGFPMCATLMAAMCFVTAVITLTFFALHESTKLASLTESLISSQSLCQSDDMASTCSGHSAPAVLVTNNERTPLLSAHTSSGSSSEIVFDKKRLKTKSKSVSVMEGISYIFMFKFLTNKLTKLTLCKREKERQTIIPIKRINEGTRVKRENLKIVKNLPCLGKCTAVYAEKQEIVDRGHTSNDRRRFEEADYRCTNSRSYGTYQNCDVLWERHRRINQMNISQTLTGAFEV